MRQRCCSDFVIAEHNPDTIPASKNEQILLLVMIELPTRMLCCKRMTVFFYACGRGFVNNGAWSAA